MSAYAYQPSIPLLLADLLRLAIERHAGGNATAVEAPSIATDFDRWLAPTGLVTTAAGLLLYALNLMAMRKMFHLRVEGREHIPDQGAFVLTPNHVSDLDALAIAAAMPLSRLRQLYWAGDIVRLFYNAASRQFCRTVHLFPVDERHPTTAVATAVRVLAAGKAQVWFPEGWRSPDGRLQRFLPGIGQVLLRSGVPAVPAYIQGAFEALPRGRRIPRLHPIALVFGAPVTADVLRTEGSGRTEEERVASALRARVARLGRGTGIQVEDAEPMSSIGQEGVEYPSEAMPSSYNCSISTSHRPSTHESDGVFGLAPFPGLVRGAALRADGKRGLS